MTIGPQQQAEEQAEEPEKTLKYDVMECDLYLRVKENPDGETASLHCKELLKDSATEVTLINPRYNESDVELQENDMVWIEVAEMPQSLRVKFFISVALMIPSLVVELS